MAKTPKIPVYYLDSCVFLALINKEANRFKVVEAILDDAEARECEVYTSQLTVAEVAFAEQEKKKRTLSDTVENKISKLWHPSAPTLLVDVHPNISAGARDIIRQAMKDGWTRGEDWSVKPPDAIHIATAILMKAEKFFTYDDRLLRLRKKAGVDICEPFLVQGRIGVNP
jgi:predicted nucleic acid-binding protein